VPRRRAGQHRGVDSALGIGFALLAALLLAFASAAEHGAANDVPDERAGGLSMLSDLLRRPLWLLGVTSDVSSFVAQGVALAFGSLLLVQPLLVTSLLFALPLSARLAGRRVSRRDWAWAALLTAGLVVFVTVGQPTAGVDRVPFRDWVPAAILVGAVVAVCGIVASTRRGAQRALALASVTGVAYGVTAAMAIGVVHTLGDGVGAVVGSWELWVMLGAAVSGWWLQQSAYQAGALTASLPIVMVGEPVVSITLGVWVLDERIHANAAGWVVLGAAALAIVTGVVALARSAARFEQSRAAPPLSAPVG
jgi:drug/metabolite transporter (DMT)-like permease